jgi:hypothetical protein
LLISDFCFSDKMIVGGKVGQPVSRQPLGVII